MRRIMSRRSHGMDVNAITEGVIWKNLLLFFFPILLGTLLQQMYNTADAIIVGKFVGKEALAAVGGATGTIINLIVGFFVGLSTGATVILSQFYGARKPNEVRQTVHTAAALALAGGAAMMVLGIAVSPVLLRMMGTPADVLPHAVTYIRIYFAGLVPSLVYNIGSGLLRAVGDSRRPLFFLIAACFTNIVLDVLLVVGFELGVKGAALATILSQFVSSVLVVYALAHSDTVYRLDVRKIRFQRQLLGRIVRIGLPAGLQSVMYSVSNIIIQAAVNGFGTNVLAAYTAFGKLDAFYWAVLNAFSIAITTFVGQNFGANRMDRVRKSLRICFGLTAGATVLVCSALLIFGKPLLGLFTDDATVLGYGMQMLHLLTPWYFTYIGIELFSGALRGAGDTLIPTLITLLGICGMRAAWVLLIVPRHHTLPTLLVSYPITWSTTSILFVLYYLWGGWLKRCRRKAGLDVPLT